MSNEEILNKSLESSKYYTNEDLRMNKNYGFLLSKQELNDYLFYKENIINDNKYETSLISWNTNKIYLYWSKELESLITEYLEFFVDDYKTHNSVYTNRNFKEVLFGILCSELEGTLNIEGVNTTRRQIESIITSNNPKNKNDKIVLNMDKGFDYISKEKEFNKETLKKLYDILSDGCLDQEDEIGDSYYRNDAVYISEHTGCPVEKIDECMESLFKFVNENMDVEDPYIKLMIPFIAHYYILYIHPYFDYNGRTARMVQLWLFMLIGDKYPLFLSEAINDNKNNYYKAIDNTRYSRNDLTYFLIYLIDLINKYSLIQKNIESIKEDIESTGEAISEKELHYLKKIILNKNIKWFNHKKFIEFGNLDITKQGALKILNNFVDMGLLDSKMNSKNEKIFILKENILKYELNK